MGIDFADALTYLLLRVGLGALTTEGWRVSGAAFLVLSAALAVAVGLIEWAGLAVLALFAGSYLAAVRTGLPIALRALAWGIVVILAAALATHQIPSIHNVLILDAAPVSVASADYTLYWNYDKGFAGTVLLCWPRLRASATVPPFT